MKSKYFIYLLLWNIVNTKADNTPIKWRNIKLRSFFTPAYDNELRNKKSKKNTIPNWLVKNSLKNAPKLLKGICTYLKSVDHGTVPSFHRLILVGAPGTGKTTMAYAIAAFLDCSITYIPAPSFFGQYRNQTAMNIQEKLSELIYSNKKQVIIIDELHKLFEHHAHKYSDDSQTAAAFWLFLDTIEKNYSNIIIIGTANNVDTLPPEIKSRFSGKIINIPLPNKQHKIEAFTNSIKNDSSITVDPSIDHVFIEKVVQQLKSCSLRDIQLLIDAAKMFQYAETTTKKNGLITLRKKHFLQALKQLHNESIVLDKKTMNTITSHIKELNNALACCLNIFSLANITMLLITGHNFFSHQ